MIANVLLAIGAGITIAISLADYFFADPQRVGMATIEANQKFHRIDLALEIPVLLLALASLRGSTKLFWSAWAIHLAFATWIGTVFIWLKFFWHW